MAQKQNGRVGQDASAHHCTSPDIVNLNPSQEAKAHQRKLILDALRLGTLTTIAAREDLGVMSPAARVMELRRAGHSIKTVRRIVWDVEGRAHRSAEYVLRAAA